MSNAQPAAEALDSMPATRAKSPLPARAPAAIWRPSFRFSRATAGVKLPVHQLLVYPEVDFAFNMASVKANPTTIPLNGPALFYFRNYYLNSSSEIADIRASPLRANLHALPPATIINAQIDPLLDDGAEYAAKLKASGVRVTRTVYPGVTHEFFGMGAVVGTARAAMAAANAALRSAFSG